MDDLEQKMLERLESKRRNAEDPATRSGLAREILQAQIALEYARRLRKERAAPWPSADNTEPVVAVDSNGHISLECP